MFLQILERNKDKIFGILCALILTVGILLRCWIFAQDYSLYADEIGLHNNIKNLNFSDISLNLQDVQVAPLLFMLISKVFYLLSGMQFWGMRILPLICSIVSVPAFYFLSKKFLNSKISVLFANVLFSLNFSLIFYSQSIKHYSAEVLVTILALLVFASVNFEELNWKKALIFGGMASFALCFSFGFAQILCAFCICFLLFQETDYYKKIQFCLISAIPFLALILLHIAVFKSIYLEQVTAFKMLNYFNPYSYSWFMNYFFFDFHNKFLPIILTVSFVTGGALFLKENFKKFFMLVLPVVIAFLLGKFYIYPFFGRLTLFLFPIFFILLAKILDCFELKNVFLKIFVSVLTICILIQGKIFLIQAKLPYVIGTAREFHQALFENGIKKGDKLFINDQTFDAFVLYPFDDFDVEEIINKQNMLIFCHDAINPFNVMPFPKGSTIHMFAAHYLWVDDTYFNSMNKWIGESCQILAKQEFKTGTYYKCINK